MGLYTRYMFVCLHSKMVYRHLSCPPLWHSSRLSELGQFSSVFDVTRPYEPPGHRESALVLQNDVQGVDNTGDVSKNFSRYHPYPLHHKRITYWSRGC